MNDKTIQKTKAMLAKHHRDAEAFVQIMKETYAGRFNDEFWSVWKESIEPVLSESPVILDLGTGLGLFLKAITERNPKAKAIGIECADYMLAAVEGLPDNAEIFAADLHDPHLALEAGSVDAAVASVVLHEMNQPVRALQEVHRCLKPGGRFYVLDWVRTPLRQYLDAEATDWSVFDSAVPVKEVDDLFVHFMEHNRFSADDLAYLLQQTGFRVLEQTLLKEGRFARLIAEKV